jgi:hypothetical protein
VQEPSFVAARPTQGFAKDNMIVIFGGESRSQFVLQSSEIVKNVAKVTQSKATFTTKTGFGQGSDAVIKILNGKMFAMDASMQKLHIYDDKSLSWTSKDIIGSTPR